jgi:hypothetical protein
MNENLEKTEATEANPSKETIQLTQSVEETKEVVEQMKQIVADKVVELEEIQKAAVEDSLAKEEKIKQLEEENKQLSEQLQKAKADKEELETKLREIEEENLLNERLSKLSDKDLLRTSEEAQLKQASKIKNMSEEDFSEYVQELEELASKQTSTPVEPKKLDEGAISTIIEKVKEEIVKNEVAASEVEVEERLRRILSNFNTEETSVPKEEKVEEIKEGAEQTSADPLKESASCKSLSVDILTAGFAEMLKRDKK